MPESAAPVLRPAEVSDEPFLRRLFAEARAPELGPLGLDAATATVLLEQQYHSQVHGYRSAHPAAELSIVLLGGVPAGRLWVDRRADAIELLDITLLEALRGRGTGTQLLSVLQAQARSAGVPLRCSALRGSRAAAWYTRLGFRQRAADEVYVGFEWSSGGG